MVKVAVVQTGSIPFDTPATIEKMLGLIDQAAAGGAKLAVFPEAFIGGYPKGLGFGTVVGVRLPAGRELYDRYSRSAITLDGPELAQVAEAAAAADLFVVVGVIERDRGTLYCTAVMISPTDGLVGHHRKLMPTAGERFIWGFGDGSTLPVVDSPAGKVGAVICWENYMPLLRTAMYAQGVEIYCAPTADDRPTWAHTAQHIALEGRVFVLSACQSIPVSAYPDDLDLQLPPPYEKYAMRGGSMIVDPMGTVLAGPVFEEETILYAEVDLAVKQGGHLDLDVTGHYARPDVFSLTVDTAPKPPVTFLS